MNLTKTHLEKKTSFENLNASIIVIVGFKVFKVSMKKKLIAAHLKGFSK